MATVFDNAISAGLTARRNLAGVAVSYDDQSAAAIDVTAVRGQPDVSIGDALLAQVSSETVDWMIPVASLAALTMPPKGGHTITHNGVTYTVSRWEGQPAWAYVDTGETEYRIHTIVTERA